MTENHLYFGDNLEMLRRYVRDETIDLVYLDPPFNSNQDYNVLFAEKDGSKSRAQIKAFEDTWEWDREAATAYQETVEAGGDVSRVMQAFRTFLGDNDMLAYLARLYRVRGRKARKALQRQSIPVLCAYDLFNPEAVERERFDHAALLTVEGGQDRTDARWGVGRSRVEDVDLMDCGQAIHHPDDA